MFKSPRDVTIGNMRANTRIQRKHEDFAYYARGHFQNRYIFLVIANQLARVVQKLDSAIHRIYH